MPDDLYNDIDQLTQDEYHQSLPDLLNMQDKNLLEMRLAHLAGLSLKMPFAVPKNINPEDKSKTTSGSFRAWRDLRPPDERLRASTDYPRQSAAFVEIYNAIPRVKTSEKVTRFEDIPSYYLGSAFEGSVFRDLCHWLHPYLCKGKDTENRIASTSIKVLEKVTQSQLIEPTVRNLLNTFTRLTGHGDLPPTTVTVIALFIASFGMEAFCGYAEDDGKTMELNLEVGDMIKYQPNARKDDS